MYLGSLDWAGWSWKSSNWLAGWFCQTGSLDVESIDGDYTSDDDYVL